MLASERAAEARRHFEDEAMQLLTQHVLESADEAACFDFPPTERPWRDILHECAASLGLWSESRDSEDGERYVFVARAMPVVACRAADAEARPKAQPKARRADGGLSSAPPAVVPDELGLVPLNQKKRDLRGIEEVQAELRAKKAKGAS